MPGGAVCRHKLAGGVYAAPRLCDAVARRWDCGVGGQGAGGCTCLASRNRWLRPLTCVTGGVFQGAIGRYQDIHASDRFGCDRNVVAGGVKW